MLAIKEINANSGIDGREIEVYSRDPQSDNQRYQELTREIINENEVDVLWAGYSSATREVIRRIINRNEQLYFYTTQYEGGVCDKTTFAVGPTARQQLGTVLPPPPRGVRSRFLHHRSGLQLRLAIARLGDGAS